MLAGVCIGLAARYALPWRSQHGSMLVPGLGAVLSAVIWVGLTWLGWPWDGGWIWAVTIAGTILLTVAFDLLLGSTRNRSDDEMLRRLGA